MLWALSLGQSKYSVDWGTCTLCISTASVLCRRWNDPLHRSWQGIHLWPVSIWLSCRNNLWGNSFGYMWSFVIILKLIFCRQRWVAAVGNALQAHLVIEFFCSIVSPFYIDIQKVIYSCTCNVKQNLSTLFLQDELKLTVNPLTGKFFGGS